MTPQFDGPFGPKWPGSPAGRATADSERLDSGRPAEDRDRRSISIGNSKKTNVATRSGVPSRSRSDTAGVSTRETGLRTALTGPGNPGSAGGLSPLPPSSKGYSQSSDPLLPDKASNAMMPRPNQTRSPTPSPSRSATGWTSCRT